MKETFIIYRDWWEAIHSLPTDIQLDALHAICEYAFEGKEPENPIISAFTTLMRASIDRDNAKKHIVQDKRREAGKRGLEKRWGKSTKKNTPPKPTALPTETPQPSSTESIDELTKLETEFEKFRRAYPGNKRGLAVELGNFKKKYPKQWKEIIPLLMPALERLLAHHKAAEEANKQGARIFVPNFAYLATWINNARWEEELPDIQIPRVTTTQTIKKESDNEPSDFGGRDY